LLLVPAFRASRHSKLQAAQPGQWSIGFWGNTTFQILIILAYILTAVGSFVSI